MIFQNVPQYPGYRGYQLLAALGGPSIVLYCPEVSLLLVAWNWVKSLSVVVGGDGGLNPITM